MKRPGIRKTSFCAVLALAALAAMAACGDDAADGLQPDAEGGLPEGAVVDPDGAVILPDGALPDGAKHDGAKHDGAPSESGTDAASDGAVEAAVEAGVDAYVPPVNPLSADYKDYGINHVIMTGQSNALANTGTLPRVATAYSNLMFNGGPQVGANPTSFIPLAAGDGGWAANGMADLISKLALDRYEFGVNPANPTQHDILISNNARSGWTYWCLRKGGCTYKAPPVPYAEAMGQVTKGMALAAAAGKTYVVRGVTNIHGESEHTSYSSGTPEFPLNDSTNNAANAVADYADALVEWQRDYEADVKAITGQAEAVPMFITQLSGWNDVRFSQIPQFQYLAHKRAPGKVVIIGASYPMQFFSDCRHYTGAARRQLGEYFAKAYARVVFEHKAWEPVRPMAISRAGNVITVQYYVPVPPLAFDTVRVPAIANMGFDFLEGGVIQPITSVTVAGDTVSITLAAAPGGGVKKLRYAQNQTPGTCQGIGSNDGKGPGARGNLRDSDATASRYGYDLHNWGIVFEEDVP